MAIKIQIQSEDDIRKLVEDDEWMMQSLKAADSLNLPDWWIGAGFLRNKVWDSLEGIKSKPTKDVDLVYFDLENITPDKDWQYDEEMRIKFPFAEWEIRNQARMHYVSKLEPFNSTEDAISHWVETATCVAVKIENEKLKFLFCHGTDDLYNLIARPISLFRDPAHIKTFYKRVNDKKWLKKWPHLRVEAS